MTLIIHIFPGIWTIYQDIGQYRIYVHSNGEIIYWPLNRIVGL